MSAEGDPDSEGGGAGRHGLEELIAERRAKRETLERDAGAFPHAFPGVEPVAGGAGRLRAPGARRGNG